MFKDANIAREIHENGFALFETGLIEEIGELHSFLSGRYPLPRDEFYWSLIANDYAENKVIQGAFCETFRTFFQKHFRDYRLLSESFLSKAPGTAQEMELHQDWCYTDEKKYDAYNVWIPLVDVTLQNGAMFFLPGSHLWFGNYRSATLETARINSKEFNPAHLKTVEIKRGQAVLFHPAVFHGSGPNLSRHDRIVATATILPEQAPFVYFQQGADSNEIIEFGLDDDAYLRQLKQMAVGGIPDAKEIRRIRYVHNALSSRDLMAKM